MMANKENIRLKMDKKRNLQKGPAWEKHIFTLFNNKTSKVKLSSKQKSKNKTLQLDKPIKHLEKTQILKQSQPLVIKVHQLQSRKLFRDRTNTIGNYTNLIRTIQTQVEYNNRKQHNKEFLDLIQPNHFPVRSQPFIDNMPPKWDIVKTLQFFQCMSMYRDKLMSDYKFKYDQLPSHQFQLKQDKTKIFKEMFLVGKKIGEGAYASVRIAMHKETNKKVAIKIYEKRQVREKERYRPIMREIRVLQMCTHYNIMKLYDVVQTNNHINLILQYISGISLRSYLKLKTNSRIKQLQAKTLFFPLFNALHYLHHKHVAHRDIKLQNILLTLHSKSKPVMFKDPYFIDFGFSTCTSQNKVLYCGTPSYMAPEIVQKIQHQGKTADIWAMGVVLWVALNGSFPFKGASDKQLFSKICNGVSINYEQNKVRIPQQISKEGRLLLYKMLRVDDKQRISAEQVLKDDWFDQIRFK